MKRLGVLLPPPPTGWDASPSQDSQHEKTRSITTSPPPLDGMLVHHRIASMKRLGVLLLPPPGWDASPSQDSQHEKTRSITTFPPPPPPGWDASSSQDSQHEKTRSITTPPPPNWMGC